MNTDEHELEFLLWALPIGAISLAGILLFLRDRYRDHKKVPHSARKASETISMVGAQGFVLGLLSLGAFFQILNSSTLPSRAGWVLLAMYLAWRSIVNWRLYIKHRSASLSDTDEPGAGTS